MPRISAIVWRGVVYNEAEWLAFRARSKRDSACAKAEDSHAPASTQGEVDRATVAVVDGPSARGAL